MSNSFILESGDCAAQIQRRSEKAVLARISEVGIEAAAREAGIPIQTAAKWSKTDGVLRVQYSEEQKEAAISRVLEIGISAAAKETGISYPTVKKWSDQAGIVVASSRNQYTEEQKKDGFDYDKFFRSFADMWLLKDSLVMEYQNLSDEHPMNYLRVNCTLQQFDEFLDFYGIEEGDKMYLAPEDRVNIW